MATLAPTIAKDADVLLHTPTFNYGAHAVISFGADAAGVSAWRTLLDFGSIAAIPPGSTIDSAILTLECTATFGTAEAFSVFRITETGWVEGAGTVAVPTVNPDPGASWNNRDNAGPTAWTLAGGDFTATGGSTGFSTPTSTGPKTYDIKNVIQACLDLGVAANFILKRDTESGNLGLGSYSSRGGATPPTLLITYTAPAGGIGGFTGSLCLLGVGG